MNIHDNLPKRIEKQLNQEHYVYALDLIKELHENVTEIIRLNAAAKKRHDESRSPYPIDPRSVAK